MPAFSGRVPGVLLLTLALTFGASACARGPEGGGPDGDRPPGASGESRAGSTAPGRTPVRLACFPNLTHAQALIGAARGDFQRALGSGASLAVRTMNAGPSVIEAVFAGEIDLAYVGPGPALNGHVRSNGDALRVLAGSMSGGAVFVTRGAGDFRSAAGLSGRRLAAPQLGNTQDIALRTWLRSKGLKTREEGGTVAVLPIANPDILSLFRRGELDGAWVPEPWGARLVAEGGGRIEIDERDHWPGRRFPTTCVIVSRRFLEAHRDLVARFVGAHVALTLWVRAHPDSAKEIVNAEILRITSQGLPRALLDEAYGRMEPAYDPMPDAFREHAARAFELGYLGGKSPDLESLFDLGPLEEALAARGLAGAGR
jgi:NitT/TauT family transport system substrate-binding protein